MQASVAIRKILKLSAKCYGPYKIIQKIGIVAYRLELPTNSQIHPMFHVSQLKKRIEPDVVAQLQPPSCGQYGRLMVQPVAILQHRIVKVNNATTVKVLV